MRHASIGTTELRALAAMAAGGLLAGAALVADGFVELGPAYPAGNARALVAATFPAVITVGAFSFWMRPLAVQLSASTVPPRIGAAHLHDSFQRGIVQTAAAALAFQAVVLLALPAAPSSDAPTIATTLSALIGVGAMTGLLVAMQRAEKVTRPGALVAESAHHVIEQIRRSARGSGEDEVGAESPRGEVVEVTSRHTGWVRSIDADGLLAGAPFGSVIALEVDVGSFIVSGATVLAHVSPAAEVTDDVRSHLATRFDIGDRRDDELDLSGSLTRFVDVAVHAATGGSSSPSTIYESLWYLSAILHELCRRQMGPAERQLDDGRILVRRKRPQADVLAATAIDRIRQVSASQPAVALELVRVLSDACEAASDEGRPDMVKAIGHQIDLSVEQCSRSGALPHDVDQVIAAARGDSADEESGAREGEYVAPSDSEFERSGGARAS